MLDLSEERRVKELNKNISCVFVALAPVPVPVPVIIRGFLAALESSIAELDKASLSAKASAEVKLYLLLEVSCGVLLDREVDAVLDIVRLLLQSLLPVVVNVVLTLTVVPVSDRGRDR